MQKTNNPTTPPKTMSCSEAGRLGAIAMNKKYTTEMRRKATKLAWKRRKAKAKLVN